jgi:hypothetical protein
MASAKILDRGFYKRPFQQLNHGSAYELGSYLKLAILCHEGGGGTVPKDLSSYNAPVTMANTSWVGSPWGWALSLDGASSSQGLTIAAANATHLDFEAGASMSFLLRFYTGSGTGNTPGLGSSLISKTDYGVQGYEIVLQSDNNIVAVGRNGAGAQAAWLGTFLDYTWNTALVTIDASGTVQMWHNSSQYGEPSVTSWGAGWIPSAAPAVDFKLGGGNYYGDCGLSECLIWKNIGPNLFPTTEQAYAAMAGYI